MRHCPHCRLNYSDDHKNCFTCQVELVEGTVPELDDSAREERLRRRKRVNPMVTVGLFGLTLTLAAGLLYAIASRTVGNVDIIEQSTIEVVRRGPPPATTEPTGPAPVGGTVALVDAAGALRTSEACAEFATRHGAILPTITPGTDMLVYAPVEHYECPVTYRPRIGAVRTDNGRLTIIVDRVPPMSRADADRYAKTLRLETDGQADPMRARQFLVLGRIAATPGTVSAAVEGR